jgi:thymidine phosphorylase
MIRPSEIIGWGKGMILDKHCVGGLPGNRTTPIVVSIVAAAGLMIPKTSSRAITSPAGTADVMETMTNVSLSVEQIRRVVETEGGCFAWGGAVHLSPADDILISVEKPLDLDSGGQLVASVLSKKIAAGSTHILIDIPVGPSAKVRTNGEAIKLESLFKEVARQLGISVEIVLTDGNQPIGTGIGPALEAIDVLQVLRGDEKYPADLRTKSITLAAHILEMSGKYPVGSGIEKATWIMNTGQAYKKFMAICLAQGGFREPALGIYQFEVKTDQAGTVQSIDNRKLARIAKLAGAPKSQGAGIRFNSPIGKCVNAGDTLYTVYAETMGELEYSKEYISTLSGVIRIAP